MGSSAGGVFLPNDPPSSTGQALINPVITGATLTGSTLSGATITGGTLSGATITGGSITSTGAVLTAPVISGAATLASGATLTTPTIKLTSQNLTATGATGGAGAAISAIYPAFVISTGADGAGVDLATGAAVPGAYYTIVNLSTTGALNIYAVGGTINGTTGTTPFVLTATGNRTAFVMCATAGAWQAYGNT